MSLSKQGHNHKSSSSIIDQNFQQRQWLKKHGKSSCLTFSDSMVQKLKNYFNSLDQDGSNSINSNQLQDPLILFGLCKNKAEVTELFSVLDIDGSGQMDFKQFLQVFRRVGAQKKRERLCRRRSERQRFQQFTSTMLGIHNKLEQGISFRLGMSIYRRKNILNAMMGHNHKEKQMGIDILNKFKSQIEDTPEMSIKLRKGKITEDALPNLNNRAHKHRRLKTTY